MGKKCQNGNGLNIFEHWEVGFGKNMGWEMGLELPLQDPLLTITFRLFQVIWLAKCPKILLELNSTTAQLDWNATKREKTEKCSFAEANLLPGYIRQVKKNKTKQKKANKPK